MFILQLIVSLFISQLIASVYLAADCFCVYLAADCFCVYLSARYRAREADVPEVDRPDQRGARDYRQVPQNNTAS